MAVVDAAHVFHEDTDGRATASVYGNACRLGPVCKSGVFAINKHLARSENALSLPYLSTIADFIDSDTAHTRGYNG